MDAGYFLTCTTNKNWVNACMANQAFLRQGMEQREKLQSLLSNNEENNGSKESRTEMTPPCDEVSIMYEEDFTILAGSSHQTREDQRGSITDDKNDDSWQTVRRKRKHNQAAAGPLNIIAITTINSLLVSKFLQIPEVPNEDSPLVVQPYKAISSNEELGVIYLNSPHDDPDTLVNVLRCNTHKIVAARALDIKQKTILVTFECKTTSSRPTRALLDNLWAKTTSARNRSARIILLPNLNTTGKGATTAAGATEPDLTPSKHRTKGKQVIICRSGSSFLPKAHGDETHPSFDGTRFAIKKIQLAVEAATGTYQVKEDNPNPDMHLLNLWASRLQAQQRYRKAKYNIRYKIQLNIATAKAKRYTKELQQQIWRRHCHSFNEKTGIRRMWRTYKGMSDEKKNKCTGQNLAIKLGITEEELVVMAGEHFFPQPTTKQLHQRYRKRIPELDHRSPADAPFTMGELIMALESAIGNTAPGPDNIIITMEAVNGYPDSQARQAHRLDPERKTDLGNFQFVQDHGEDGAGENYEGVLYEIGGLNTIEEIAQENKISQTLRFEETEPGRKILRALGHNNKLKTLPSRYDGSPDIKVFTETTRQMQPHGRSYRQSHPTKAQCTSSYMKTSKEASTHRK
ncbi:hypothetical protein HPB47_024825 [Ixodes persulcatus]|uniref:Uncharacterized protein n=1 Tax=Ixodes persulcatus TaxID=34615 RepID=A0AC60Q5L7_IXOPE|nr:hypothetical protein HPB47_024825 [Ixodes persulcatus]